MKKLMIVAKNELMRYFISPLAYVYLVSFLILNGACAFYFGHFFERGQASLEPMFWYQPWLYLLFIPGISMRLWAEEFRSKTIVQIMTLPVSAEVLVWGKFLASWIFCAIALILTFPFWITVNILGAPDNAVIAVSYFGSFVLAGCMLAISQTMSALTKNQVIALVLAVAANLLFFWSGIEFVLSFFRLFLPDYMIDAIASFSFITHFDTIIRGLLELRDILFFMSVILLFNFTTILIVSFKTAGTSAWLRSTGRGFYIFAWCMLVVGFMGLNLLANNLTRGTQVDFSQDRLFTLSDNTESILQNLPEPVTAKLYFSPLLEKRSAGLRQLFDKTRLLLQQYKNASNGRFDYRIYYPQNLDNNEDRAIADGIQPIPLIDINQNAVFGLTLTDTLQNKQTIPLLTVVNPATLEQDLTSKIYQLSHSKKTVGVISSLGLSGGFTTESMIYQPWEIMNRIGSFYNIRYIKTPEDFKERPDVLMIVHPLDLSPEMVEAVKGYSKDYGNILLLLDTAAEATRLYSSVNHPFEPSDLKGLDAFWGFRFYNEYVVADLDNSILVDATSNYKNNPAFTQDVIQFKLKKENFNPYHLITKNLQSLLMSSASIILPAGDDVNFIPLLEGSKNSALMPVSVVYDGLNPRQILSFFEADDNPKVLAAAISGKTNDNPFHLIVVGDTDFIYDSFWTSSTTVMEQTYFHTLFNNADFILNSLDYLSNNPDLAGLRGKSARNREFTEIERLRKQKILEFKLKEEEIFNKINQTKAGLQEIWSKKNFENRETFTADELALISGIRKKLDEQRRELSDIRKQAGMEMEKISATVKFVNIFALPLLLTLVLLMALLKKHHRQQRQKSGFSFNRQLAKLSLAAAVIFGAGLLSVYFANRSDIQKYEDKLMFPELAGQINDVQKIVIRNHDTVLTFSKEGGLWKLDEHPEFAVFQERIRSFLSALMSARYYEKKSDKAENLHRFGLQPIEAENSPNTRIELYSENSELIQPLEVGTYNLDLGRGSKAAYVKFDGQFQVWLAEADFIDLSTDWNQWTYSKLWDLRYGRLSSFNEIKDADKTADLMRVILNVPLAGATEKLDNPRNIGKITLHGELADPVVLNFYKNNNQIYVSYDFPDNMTDYHLNTFAKAADNRYFEISTENWEKVKNAARIK